MSFGNRVRLTFLFQYKILWWTENVNQIIDLFIIPDCLLRWFPLILNRVLLVLLPPEGASSVSFAFLPVDWQEDSQAVNTQDYCLCMARDHSDFIVPWIHGVGMGPLYKALCMFHLFFWRGIEEILCERHVLVGRLSPPESQNKVVVVKPPPTKL